MLKLGLMLGGIAFLWVSWASWSAGYPPEIAAVRGLIGFMAICTVAYFAELVVSTATPVAGEAAAGGSVAQPAIAPPEQMPALPEGALPEIPAPILGVPDAAAAEAAEAGEAAEAAAELEQAA